MTGTQSQRKLLVKPIIMFLKVPESGAYFRSQIPLSVYVKLKRTRVAISARISRLNTSLSIMAYFCFLCSLLRRKNTQRKRTRERQKKLQPMESFNLPSTDTRSFILKLAVSMLKYTRKPTNSSDITAMRRFYPLMTN